MVRASCVAVRPGGNACGVRGFRRGGLGARRVALMCGDRWQREQKTLWHSGLLVFLTLLLNDCLDLIGEDSSGRRSALCIPLTTKPAFINFQIHTQVFMFSPMTGKLKIDGRGGILRRVVLKQLLTKNGPILD